MKYTFKVGDVVKFNSQPDAALFKITDIFGFVLEIIPINPPAGVNPAKQYIHKDLAILVS